VFEGCQRPFGAFREASGISRGRTLKRFAPMSVLENNLRPMSFGANAKGAAQCARREFERA
jgi:hypothetical protein